jgi:circadian clock protein KaiC
VVDATEPTWQSGRASFGIADLDALIGGGLNVGTATLLAGSPGVGKTVLGRHFIAEGVRAQEPTLFLGFLESPAQLREKARAFGMDLDPAEASGLLRLLVLRAHDLEADQIAWLVSEAVERRRVRRLVIDSVAELQRGLASEARIPEFLAALASYLRAHEVTTYLTLDVATIVGPSLELAGPQLSAMADNLLSLRQAEYHGRLHRLLSVLKMRFSGYESAIYELTVTPGRGVEIVGPAPLGEGILSGVPRLPGGLAPQEQPVGTQGAAWPSS